MVAGRQEQALRMHARGVVSFREVSSGFYYSSAEEREKLVASERKFTDEKVRQAHPRL